MRINLSRLIKTAVFSLTLLLSSFVYEAEAQTLVGSVWQLQNPVPESVSSIIMFNQDGTFNASFLDLQTGKTTYSKGYYKVSATTLKIIYNERLIFTYSLSWINIHMVEMTKGNNIYLYALKGSSQDTWYTNYVNSLSQI